MCEIDMYPSGKNKYYFAVILNEDNFLCTSKQIANFLSLPVKTYNQLVIDKVIKHDGYRIVGKNYANGFDLDFERRDCEKSVYVERFKQTFLEELTLALLGGI